MRVKKKSDLSPQGRFEPQEHSKRMRSTSARAFREIKEEGLLSKQRWVVYKRLFAHGPMTGAELNQDLDSPSCHKRLSELRDLGVVEEVGKRPCSVTGKIAIEWDVTEALPSEKNKTVSKPSSKHLLEALLQMRHYWRLRNKAGNPPSLGLVKTMKWIVSMLPQCDMCDGTGHCNGTKCPTCNGAGVTA